MMYRTVKQSFKAWFWCSLLVLASCEACETGGKPEDSDLRQDLDMPGDQSDRPDQSDKPDQEDLPDMREPPRVESSCSDGLDNDGDGRVDCADEDCAGALCEMLPSVDVSDWPALPENGGLNAGDVAWSLLDEDNPVHQGLSRDKVDLWQASVARGKVINTQGLAVPGARVSFFGRPELGWTITRHDGEFDLVTPPGERLLVEVSHESAPKVYRSLQQGAREISWVSAPIVLTPYSSKVTRVELGREQVIEGERIQDSDGARTARIYMPEGVSAQLEFADGRRQDVGELHVRITEYTQGALGPQAMPGPLPASIAYTWAAELSADEAVSAGATHVRFSDKVSVYLDNFISAPVGMEIPVGIYEPTTNRWEDEPNALIIAVLGVREGLALLDLDGDGLEDNETNLNDWGISKKEQQIIANTFKVGESFWRARINHFSPLDCNFFADRDPDDFVIPDPRGFKKPEAPRKKGKRGWNDKDCSQEGSVIDCQTQSLRDAIPIAGTDHALWVGGENALDDSIIEIDLLEGISNTQFSTERVTGMKVVVNFAGHRLEHRLTKAEVLADARLKIALPQTDAWGRSLLNRSLAGTVTVEVEHRFDLLGVMTATNGGAGGGAGGGSGSFNRSRVSSPTFFGSRSRDTVALGYEKAFTASFSVVFTPSISAVHHLKSGRVVVRGDRTSFTNNGTDSFSESITHLTALGYPVEGSGYMCTNCYDPPLPNEYNPAQGFSAVAVGPSGALYAFFNPRICRGGDGVSSQSYTCETPRALARLHHDMERNTFEVIALYDTIQTYIAGDHKAIVSADGAWIYSLETAITNARHRRITRYNTTTGDMEEVVDLTKISTPQCKSQSFIDFDLTADGSLLVLESAQITPNDPDGQRYIDGEPCVKKIYPDQSIEELWFFQDDWLSYALPNPNEATHVALQPYKISSRNDGSFSLLVGSTIFSLDGRSTPVGILNFTGSPTPEVLPIVSEDTRVEEVFSGTFVSFKAYEKFYSLYTTVKSKSNAAFVGNYVHLKINRQGTLRLAGGSLDGNAKPCHRFKHSDSASCALRDRMIHEDGAGKLYFSSGQSIYVTSPHPLTPDGNEIAVADPERHEIYTFDWAGRHLATYDARLGYAIRQMVRDPQQRLIGLDELHPKMSLSISWEDDQLSQLSSSYGHLTRVDTQPGLLTITLPDGRTEQVAFDVHGNITARTRPDGTQTQYEWDQDIRLSAVRFPQMHGSRTLTRQSIDEGVEVAVSDPLNLVTRYFTRVSPDGTLTRRVTTPTGAYSELVSPSPGSLRQATLRAVDGTITTYNTAPLYGSAYGTESVDATSLTITTPAGKTMTYESVEEIELAPRLQSGEPLWKSRKLTTTRSGAGVTRRVVDTWDAALGRRRITTPGQINVDTYYDDKGNITSYEVPSLAPKTYSYDANELLTSMQHGDQTASLGYRDGLLSSTENALGERFTYAYDMTDRLTSITWPSGRTWQYDFGARDELRSLTLPKGGTFALKYDARDNMTELSVPGLGPLKREYEAGERLTRTTLPSGESITRTYDSVGRITAITSPQAVISVTYDSNLDRAATLTRTPLTGGAPHTLSLRYDGSALTGWSTSHANTSHDVETVRNAVLEITAVQENGVTRNFTKGSDGLSNAIGSWLVTRNGPMRAISSLTTGSGSNAMRVEQRFDTLGRLAQRSVWVGGIKRGEWSQQWDQAGRLSQRTLWRSNPMNTETILYSYDLDGQLTKEASTQRTIDYLYDADGNLTQAHGSTFTHDASGRLLSQDAVPVTHDSNGRLSDFQGWQLSYGAMGELLMARHPQQLMTIDYEWDALGRMVRQTSGAGSIRFYYANPGRLNQVTSILDETSAVTTYLFYADDDTLFAVERDGRRYVVLSDSVGTPMQMWDETGALVFERQRDAWGRVLNQQSTLSWELWIGYAGGIEHPDTGLVRFGLRDYHVELGRWVALDPSGFEGSPLNLYMYASNNPLQFRDPTGLFCVGGTAFAGFGGGAQVCFTDKGTSVCGELGFGVGGGLDLQPMADLAREGGELEVALKAGIGPLAAEAIVKENDCMKTSGDLSVIGGPFTKSLVDNSNSKASAGLDGASNLGDMRSPEISRNAARAKLADMLKFKTGLEGKATYKHCAQIPR